MLIVALSGRAQCRSPTSAAFASPLSGANRLYSVKVCRAGYQVVWMPAALSSSRKPSRLKRSGSRIGKAKWEARSTAYSPKHSSMPGISASRSR